MNNKPPQDNQTDNARKEKKIIVVPPTTPINNSQNINLSSLPEIAQTLLSSPENAQILMQNVMSSPQFNNLTNAIMETVQNMPAYRNVEINDAIQMEMLNQTNDETNPFIPLMQDLLRNVITRNILYTPLQILLDKYPQWLEQNQSQLSPADLQRYSEQQAVIQEICDALHSETDSDPENVRSERIDVIISLFYRLQELGSPPEEITRSTFPTLQFNQQGNPILPEGANMNNLNELCNIM